METNYLINVMKRLILFSLITLLFAAIPNVALAQERASVTAQLEAQYPGAFVVFHEAYGGYYSVKLNYGKPDVTEGAFDVNGKMVIPLNKYSYMCKHDSYYGVKIGDKAGACDLNGNEIVPCNYYYVITGNTKGVMRVKDSEGGAYYDYVIDGSATAQANNVVQEDQSIKAQIKSRYPGSLVVYHEGGGGWYGIILNYGSSSQKEGACDLAGNEIIAPDRYSSVVRHDAYGGYFTVKIGNKEGACDINGKQIVPCEFANVFCSGNKMLVQKTKAQKDYAYCDYYAPAYAYSNSKPVTTQTNTFVAPVEDRNLYTIYAKEYVEKRVNKWQVKDEFETTAAYKARVNDTTREALIASLAKEAEVEFINQAKNQFKQQFTISTYDADNESFMFSSPNGDYVIKVPVGEARAFKENFKYNADKSIFAVIDNKARLAKLVMTSGGKDYQSADVEYAQVQVDYNFAPIQIEAEAAQTMATNKPTIQQSSVSVGTVSDVDRDIPVNNTVNDKTFAVVIANEKYQKESQVQFAVNDGKIFAEYCKKTLGLPAKNVHLVENATLNNIKFEINWLKQVISAYEGEAKVLFYYAGHGIPDETQRTAYLLPVDGYGSDVTTGFSLDELYGALGTLPSKSVTIMLDACFSGAKRDGGMMAAARGIAIKFKPGQPIGNTVVFSASQNDETAYPHKEKGHGLFTYYLLKKLKESKGAVSYEDLSNYITDNVRQQSIVLNSKSQTPTTIPSPAVDQQWKGWTLK